MIRRGSWIRVSRLIEKRLDPDRCRQWDDHSRPGDWPPKYNEPGIYLANLGLGLRMSIAEASELSVARCEDAIFSIVPGRLAVLMNHDWGVWYCEMPNKPMLSDRPSAGR